MMNLKDSCTRAAIRRIWQKNKWGGRAIHLWGGFIILLKDIEEWKGKWLAQIEKERNAPESKIKMPQEYYDMLEKDANIRNRFTINWSLLKGEVKGKYFISIHRESAHEHHKFCAPEEDLR